MRKKVTELQVCCGYEAIASLVIESDQWFDSERLPIVDEKEIEYLESIISGDYMLNLEYVVFRDIEYDEDVTVVAVRDE